MGVKREDGESDPMAVACELHLTISVVIRASHQPSVEGTTALLHLYTHEDRMASLQIYCHRT